MTPRYYDCTDIHVTAAAVTNTPTLTINYQVFTAMLFDYLPGFITSEHLNQAKTGITSGDALKELLETGVRSAKATSSTASTSTPVMIDSPMKPAARKQLLSSADSVVLQSYDSREAGASGSITAATTTTATSSTSADTYAASVDSESPTEHSRALLASMQLHAVVSDPCCSMYLESYLSKVTARSKKSSSKASSKTSTNKGDSPELQVPAFAPDLIMACLLEIDDFKRADDRAHRSHRAQLIISRYGIAEFGVEDLIQMRTACVRDVDPSAFDLVYVLLSTRLLIEHAQVCSSSMLHAIVMYTCKDAQLQLICSSLSALAVLAACYQHCIRCIAQEHMCLWQQRKSVKCSCTLLLNTLCTLLNNTTQGFIESSEFKELDRVLQQHNAFSTASDTASKVGHIRNFVLEKLGLKESVHTTSTVEALQNVEDLLQTLEGVLSLALGRSLFKRFSTQQFQEENVCFFLEVMFYKLESYLTPAEGSVIYADRTNVSATKQQQVFVLLLYYFTGYH
jgi:hypothetical protein